ncbi:hypothetical protein A3H10_01875 [Candidatus Uhrbacteria bacterium RIFCSPLOWO2_12_FULL_46_10]|uniref:Uncharacterized protein n=1 Tax=Candidatus Uhrbacteria bacterium RIFCSPLOWO2_01_FULL_47_25 TaxID=1802402 RepID=A0A1F7URE3_9BACT|nr:MAG: hypothetical protein UX68_C0039G0007 [Parcubacteria group bacterium GW2011_GWA2_46_9]OGL60972.1 MAG: hypothetical protein A2752_00560 [Candidatus Uhrbacteria bacterium RIFCSPHIGHO2_01_FULL_46_23]OGL69184.1 MAG: hypothetical protein A3D60_04765 [Candidatus Uhrbacteria bacterium RIFCSPHIGHO2_02_FULL_47_29]OGL75313.1 MAG: hypothetical protein A3E96_01445 [Candidatus Uhrbacteria bacterium RIFCSPHIGHO2_12_FULL_46_13]OGL80247.1 MAG: hypothetical protein A2936_02670 [Candidatus Uhrbacteria bac
MPNQANFSVILAVRYAKITIALLMLVGVIWVAFFLYDNLYKPITQAMVTAELKAKVVLTNVNKKELTEVIDLIEKNTKLPTLDWSSLADPFAGNRLPPSSSSSSTNNKAPTTSPAVTAPQ